MKRQLSKSFFQELKSGSLACVRIAVLQDDTLSLELRNTSIIVYYRGGKLFEIKNSKDKYKFISIDSNYNKANYPLPNLKIATIDQDLGGYICTAKEVIDKYFSIKTERTRYSLENEIRQHIIRENNTAKQAGETDFFILDTEYSTPNKKKFDIVAIEWEAVSSCRKLQKKYKPKLVIFELKYAGKAVSNKCGLSSHLLDFNNFICNKQAVDNFKEDMLVVLSQKRELGLIPCLSFEKKKDVNTNDVVSFAEDIDFVNIIANYKAESTILLNEVNDCSSFKMITSNFMGYGLYSKNILDKEETIKYLCK